MTIDTPGFVPEEQIDLTNAETVTRILEEGTPEELEKFRAFNNLTPERVRLVSDFAKLRRRTVEQCTVEREERKARDPKATEEELSAGAYKEVIEPQVRDTVFVLRRKGYATYESGFSASYDRQMISFEKNHLENFQLPEDLVQKLAGLGVKAAVEPNRISLTFEKYVELDEIKKIWDEIAEALPDLGGPAEPSQIQGAKQFRKKTKRNIIVRRKLIVKFNFMAEEERFFQICPACGEPLPEGRSVHAQCAQAVMRMMVEAEPELSQGGKTLQKDLSSAFAAGDIKRFNELMAVLSEVVRSRKLSVEDGFYIFKWLKINKQAELIDIAKEQDEVKFIATTADLDLLDAFHEEFILEFSNEILTRYRSRKAALH